jgi:hypothetical protein
LESGVQLDAASIHPPSLTGGVAYDQGMIRHIPGHHCPGLHKGIASNNVAVDNGGIGADVGPGLDQSGSDFFQSSKSNKWISPSTAPVFFTGSSMVGSFPIFASVLNFRVQGRCLTIAPTSGL